MAWRERENYGEGEDWWNGPDVQDPYAPAQQQPTTPNWTDPDNAPPDWLHNPNAAPPGPTEPGLFWSFQDGMWRLVASPRAPQPTPAPTAPTGGDYTPPGGYGGASSGGGSPYDAIGQQPARPNFSAYESAGPFNPRNATFSFDPYKPSSWEDAENEPGYKAARSELRKQVEAGAAYRGMVRSGMAIGDLYKNLDALGQQNFATFDNRRFRNYSSDRDLAAQKFGLEYGVDRDVYDRRAQDIDRGNNYRFNTESAAANDVLGRWQEQVRSLTQLGRPVD